MYEQYYGLDERPFSITPNPRFVYLSQRHRDALAHLLYGVGQGGSGGFVQLTGEVGTGKTTLCRVLLEQIPEHTRVALILNPMLSPAELLRAICVELEIDVGDTDGSLQQVQDRLNRFLLECHADGERVVLIIDEAQNMSRDGLEQIRLLTNLETATDKLLQIILLGQPELREVLARPELRQLAQRITARYHLDPLIAGETESYVRHRLEVAGAERCPFTARGLRALHAASGGVPRLINIIADRALMAGYVREVDRIDRSLVRAAAREVAGEEWDEGSGWLRGALAAAAVAVILVGGGSLAWLMISAGGDSRAAGNPTWQTLLHDNDAPMAWDELAAAWPQLSRSDIAAACAEENRGESNNGVACRLLRGNWAFVRRLNLPVVLRLDEPPDSHVLLVGMDGERLTLRARGQDFSIPATRIDRRWLGDFYVAWPDHGRLLRQGDLGEEVAQMKALAARVETPAWHDGVDERFDAAFQRWVADFQRHLGIEADGIIGPSTRLFLRAPHEQAPSLMASESSGE